MKMLALTGAITVALISMPVHAGDSQQDADRPTRERVRQADPAQGNPPNRRYGMGMAPPRGGEEYLPVLTVVEGQVAAEAGVEVEDRITHMNGMAVGELSREALVAALRGTPLTIVVDRGGERLTFEMSLADADATPPAPPTPEQVAAYGGAALELADLLEQRYLYAEVGSAYAARLREDAAAGHYATMAGPTAFAEQLTADLAEVSVDQHLRVRAADGNVPGMRQGGSADPESLGVRESGWLQDDIAFMRISMMPETPAATEWADAFMREHAEARALILDLRSCRGGTLAMMNGFLPYLYDQPTHLLTMDMRPAADQEMVDWLDGTPELRRVETDGSVVRWEHVIEPADGARPEMPVYVLTDFTASACEHLTQALKSTGRATVVGATTRGAGHFVNFHDFGDGFSVVLPIGRTFDPATGEDWEGDGIAPDVVVDPQEAEAVALEMILASDT
jgi:C-terminal processing protease CtpA/Prc